MNKAELLHRFTLELVIIFICYFSFSFILDGLWLWFVTFITAHSLCAVFNGHPFAVLVHDAGVHSVCYYKDKKKFLEYVKKMEERLNRSQPGYLSGAFVFGSIVKGVFRETSDLDVRFIANTGFINALLAANLVFLERLRATLCGFPMDLYMFRDKHETALKMDVNNESAVALYSDSSHTEEMFENISTLDEMTHELLSNPDINTVSKPPRALVIASGGKPLTDVLLCIKNLPLRATIATIYPDCESDNVKKLAWKTFCFSGSNGNIKKLIKNSWLSLYLILRDRPDYIISTGSSLVIPTCLIGKMLRSKLIYIEMSDGNKNISKVGKFLYKYSNLFIVQSDGFLKSFPKAVIVNNINTDPEKNNISSLIHQFINSK